jgi:hypothetical protein
LTSSGELEASQTTLTPPTGKRHFELARLGWQLSMDFSDACGCPVPSPFLLQRRAHTKSMQNHLATSGNVFEGFDYW